MIIDGKEYAKIGERAYTRHAVDRMQPSTLGQPVGVGREIGRNCPPNFIEEIINKNVKRVEESITIFMDPGGNFEIITEKMGAIIITVKRIA